MDASLNAACIWLWCSPFSRSIRFTITLLSNICVCVCLNSGGLSQLRMGSLKLLSVLQEFWALLRLFNSSMKALHCHQRISETSVVGDNFTSIALLEKILFEVQMCCAISFPIVWCFNCHLIPFPLNSLAYSSKAVVSALCPVLISGSVHGCWRVNVWAHACIHALRNTLHREKACVSQGV